MPNFENFNNSLGYLIKSIKYLISGITHGGQTDTVLQSELDTPIEQESKVIQIRNAISPNMENCRKSREYKHLLFL